MALMYTPPGALGSDCPEFKLQDTAGHTYTKDFLTGHKASLVMFICNHCPYVKAVESRLLTLAHEVLHLGVRILAISSNDAKKYSEDSLENMRLKATQNNYPFPYLYDKDQAAAQSFGAVCTPDFFLYDESLKLRYRGRLDDSWKDAQKVTKQELRHAILQLLNNQQVSETQYPSMGCSIKWLAP